MADEVARREAEKENARQKAATEVSLRAETVDWAWFDLYYGAAHAYRDWASSLEKPRNRTGNVRDQSVPLSSPTPVPDAGVTFKKAEEYFQQALRFRSSGWRRPTEESPAAIKSLHTFTSTTARSTRRKRLLNAPSNSDVWTATRGPV